MDMKKLFEDFTSYVNRMDNVSIKKSISKAIKHSINSALLDSETDKEMECMLNSPKVREDY